MAKKDLFAPPTEEELNDEALFAPPTEEEIEGPGLLSKAKELGGDVLSGIGTAVDYTYAPIRQAMMAPKRILTGDVAEGLLAPFTQLGKSPNEAPSTEQVLEEYGVPKSKKVSPFASTNPFGASTYELDPAEGDPDTVTIEPAKAGGFLVDSLAGSAGMDLAGKGLVKGLNIAKQVTPELKGLIGAAEVADDFPSPLANATEGVSPNSFKGIEAKLKATGALDTELPSKERLSDIEKILPDLNYKPTGIHKEMLSSKSNLDELRAKFKELPSKERDLLDKYDQAMKSEIQDKIQGVSKQFNPQPRDLVKSGDEFMSSVDETYKANKERMGPMFKAIDKVQIPKEVHLDTLVNRLAEEIPEVGKNLEVLEGGQLKLRPFSPKMGLSRKEYTEINSVFDAINEGSLDFKEMQNIREYLRKGIDPANPRETAALSGMRKALLGHMEDLIQYKKPGLDVRGTFKQWAINEKNLDDITNIIGGKVGGFDDALKADPSKVITRIFSNPKNLRIIKDKMPPEQFNGLVGDYINNIYSKSFDTAKNQFSSARFAQELKRAGPVLAEVAPKELERLSALADLGKIIPDMASINPSGTAKTSALLEAGKKAMNLQFGEAAGELVKGGKGLLSSRMAKKAAEETLSGASKGKKKAKMVQGLIGGKFNE